MEKHVLQWHIIHKCNLRCTHCYQEDYASELSRDDLTSIFNQYVNFCKSMNYKGHINFTGGEPFLSEDLFYLLGLCEDADISYGILTNGVLLNRDIVEKLKQCKKLSFVQVSIDGVEKTHDSIRGQGNFANAMKGLRLLRNAGVQTMVAFTCHKNNYHELRDVIKLVRKNKIDRFWVDRLIPMGSSHEDILSTDEYREVIDILTYEHNRKTLLNKLLKTNPRTTIHINRAIQFLGGGESYYVCSAGDKLLTVLADGTLLPCRRLPIPIGNLLTSDMLELYNNSDLIKELCEKKIPEECKPCPKADKCLGGAKCLSYAVKGDYNIKDINCYK